MKVQTMSSHPASSPSLRAGSSSNTTYRDRVRSERFGMATQLALGAADVYVATTGAFAAETVLGQYTPAMAGIMAAGHAIYGLNRAFPESVDGYYSSTPDHWRPREPGRTAVGVGHLITGFGFAALAMGAGGWSLPLIAIGEGSILMGKHLVKQD